MVDLKTDRLEEAFSEAIRNVKDQDKPQLVSITEQIDERDPLLFFEAAKHTELDRIFWKHTMDSFCIVGAGNVCEITADRERYHATEESWNRLKEEAVIQNPYKAAGTGLLALGGMAFDPQERQSKLWEDFPVSSFIVPEYMLTENGSTYYFTVNVMVHKDDHPLQLAQGCLNMKNELLNNDPQFGKGAAISMKREIAAKQWKDSVHLATEQIKEKKAKKIVLARELRVSLTKEAEIAVLLKALISMQPNSYVFAFERGSNCFVGATPERLVKVERQHVLSTCLAGTAPRGETEAADAKISEELLNDQKNREEHDFVVQMIKSAIKDCCADIEIPETPVVYPLKNLQHLYTPVTATLKKDCSIFDLVARLHPTPALGGTPTEKALRFMREHEPLPRGWYGAPIGWLDSNGNGEFAVAIRSGLIQGDEVSLFAGCGVVKDSDIEAEYEETNIKFLPMLSALEGDK
jgi:menaquinone-specific isochorismate synthase